MAAKKTSKSSKYGGVALPAARRTAALTTCRAFTLIEVSIAILILAGALIVLLGLQSSLISRTLADERSQQAMLLARRILTAIELESEGLPVEERRFDGLKALEEFDMLGDERQDSERLRDFMVTLKVDSVGLPGVGEEAMRRVDLSVAWGGGSASEQIEVLYFVPIEPKQPTEEEVDEE
jgi:prepilin-type N-terminal cleavage/methylation domain-containing protein